MYNVTDEYKPGIYAQERTIKSRLTFKVAPVDLAGDTPSIISSPTFVASNNAQLTDSLNDNTLQLSTWETDRTMLDGSFTFMGTSATERGHVGWVSNNLCESDGQFLNVTYISLEYAQSHTSGGLTIVFDKAQDEYATDFVIVIRDSANVVIHTETVTGNTDAIYALSQTLTDFRKIGIQFYGWSKPFRRARIAEIVPGLVLTYDNNQLINMKLSEESDPTSSTLVIPQFEFTLDNSLSTFNMYDTSGLYSFLQERQEIVPELGLELGNRTEWVPLGTFLLSEWKADFGSLTATFKARSKLDLLDDVYYQYTAPIAMPLGNVMESILNAAGIGSYAIDSTLYTVNVIPYSDKIKSRTALQLAAMAGRAQVFVGRDNVLYIKSAFGETTDEAITKEEQWEEPQIELLKATKKVTVAYYNQSGVKAGEASVTNAAVASGQTLTIEKNTFINDSAHAQDVAEWLMGLSQYRKKITLDYRGNPASELYDMNQIESRFINNINAYLTKLELSYEGYLTARAEGVSN